LDQAGLPDRTAQAILDFTYHFDSLLQLADYKELSNLLPIRERWRLLPLLLDQAVAVDLETDGAWNAGSVTCLSVRSQAQAACWVRGSDPTPALEMLERAQVLLTFAGTRFDLPLLHACWPSLRLPGLHVDLAPLTRKLGISGGLKGLEVQAGWCRAPHVAALRGPDAIRLWQEWRLGRRESLALLCEYNLEDVWCLPKLAAWVHDGLAAKAARATAGQAVPVPLTPAWVERPEAGPTILRALARALDLAVPPGDLPVT
jgi:hypothetical protein